MPWQLIFVAPWAVLLVAIPFHVLATETGNQTLRRATLVIMAGVAVPCIVAELVFVVVASGWGD